MFLLLTCSLLIYPGGSSSEAVALDTAPNILWILSDDQRADTVAALGNETIKTPALDRLVRTGTSFSSAYCMGSTSGAVCAPSRYMMMTGRSLHRLPGNVFNIPAGEITLPQKLRDAGWNTFFSGKWHSGKASFRRSFTAGGEIFFGGMGSHTKLLVHDFDPEGKYPNEKRHPLKSFSSTAFTDAAIEFIEQQGRIEERSPFLACVFFTAPHDPRTPPAEYKNMYPAKQMPLPGNFLPEHPFDNGEMTIRDEKLAPWPRTSEVVKEHISDYYGMISQLDTQVGRLLKALHENGLSEDTIVIFTSDHGLAVGSHGLLGKQNLYEHSTRVPLLVAGPGISAGKQIDAPVYLHDLVATISEWAGIEPPEKSEGMSLSGLVSGSEGNWREGIYTAYKNVQRAVRIGEWKLIHYPALNRTQLFHLETDPEEKLDVSEIPENETIQKKLLVQLQDFRMAAGDTMIQRDD